MLIDRVLQTIEKYNMFSPSDTVVAAVSGGVDSVVLLHVLHSLREQLGIELHIAHLNHGIRGKEADEDAEFVAELARQSNVPYSIEKVDVPSLKKDWKMGTEEAARKARYDFLNRTADKVKASRIATAHTASDQAETVLMNVLRGSGIDGIGGMPPVRDRIVRPLIDVFREDILEYQKEHSLKFREDTTNVETTYRRNKIRHELLPVLRDYNPRVDDALARLSETAREDNEVLKHISEEVYSGIAEKGQNFISFPLQAFLDQPKAIQRRLIRTAVSELLGTLVDVGFIHIEHLLNRLHEPGVYEVELPQGTARVRKTPDNVSVYLVKLEEDVPEILPRTLDIPGTVEIPELGLTVTAEALIGEVDWKRPRESMDVVIDAGKVEGIVTVRQWLPGDRIVPLGMGQSKKLQDLFVDRKIPKSQRMRTPVVADEEKILWVPGAAVSQEAAVTPETTRFLNLRVTR